MSNPGEGSDPGIVPAPPAEGGGPSIGRRRRVRPAWVAGLALAGLAAAGLYGVTQVPPELLAQVVPPARPPEPAPAPANPAEITGPVDDPSRHSRLRIVPGAGGAGPVVVLERPGKIHSLRDVTTGQHDPQGHVPPFLGLLTREVCRQAALMAAREGFAAATRDGTLGEAMAGGDAGGPALEVVGPVEDGAFAAIRLDRVGGAKPVPVLSLGLVKLRPGEHDRIDLVGLVEGAEAASRAELPAALGKEGLAPSAPKVDPKAVVPEGVEAQLGRMAFVDQFAAVRALHAAIRADGESPARLGALARGYANLGLLTEHQWDAMHKAFQARALLYAQRMLAASPKSPADALRHRAYALTLAGLHKAALADLEAASAAPAEAEAEVQKVPAWADLLDAMCRYDTRRLVARAGRDDQLAALLAAVSLEGVGWSTATYNAARAAIRANPECFRAVDLLCGVGGVSNLHTATVIGPRVLEQVVPRRLAALPGAPAGLLDQGVGSDLASALGRGADPARDRGEPSWGAAARFVRETRFLQVWRRLAFMRDNWSVPTQEYWEGVEGLVSDHPFRPFLRTFVDAGPSTEFAAFAREVDAADLTRVAYPLTESFRGVLDPTDFILTVSLTFHHGDSAAHDLTAAIRSGTSPVKSARLLLAACPSSPIAMGTLVDEDWPTAGAHLAEYEKAVGDQPAFL